MLDKCKALLFLKELQEAACNSAREKGSTVKTALKMGAGMSPHRRGGDR